MKTFFCLILKVSKIELFNLYENKMFSAELGSFM